MSILIVILLIFVCVSLFFVVWYFHDKYLSLEKEYNELVDDYNELVQFENLEEIYDCNKFTLYMNKKWIKPE